MDVQDGFPAMDPSEQAFMLHFEVTVSSKTSDGSPRLLLVEEHSKIICTPRIGASLKNKIVCEDNRGQWIRPEKDSFLVAHLSHLNAEACKIAGVSREWSPS